MIERQLSKGARKKQSDDTLDGHTADVKVVDVKQVREEQLHRYMVGPDPICVPIDRKID